MGIVIDSSQNSSKNLGNRQRFLRRIQANAKHSVKKIIDKMPVKDIVDGKGITVPVNGKYLTREPSFQHDSQSGQDKIVLPGNKKYMQGDIVDKPLSKKSEKGNQASDSGEGIDPFSFVLTKEEFMKIFFEGLELPDLVKTRLMDTEIYKLSRAGFSPDGNPSQLDIRRTFQNSFARKKALKRPKSTELDELTKKLEVLKNKSVRTKNVLMEIEALEKKIDDLNKKRRRIPYIDPVDIRYRRYERQPEPSTSAVMFCLMDVSGSMGRHEKDLAKRFFILLYLFLEQKYQKVEIVYIRHTQIAKEVTEKEFFYGTETGGTVVSSAFELLIDLIQERFQSDQWNIYVAQASDGDNFSSDNEYCKNLLVHNIIPQIQYLAYIEVREDRSGFADILRDSGLWSLYKKLSSQFQKVNYKRAISDDEIYPVFRELFEKGVTVT